MARALVLAPAFVALVALGVGAACSDPGSTGGSGDTLVDDTRPQPRPPQNPDEGMDASDDGALYGEGGADLSACDTCACTPDQYYCFGGATRRARRVNAAKDAEAEAAACTVPSTAADGGDPGLSPVVGCNALPKGCTDCACIIAALQPAYSCYLVCADDGNQMLVYCPSR